MSRPAKGNPEISEEPSNWNLAPAHGKRNLSLHRHKRLILALVWCFAACRSTSPEARFEFSRPQMGAPFRVVLYAPDRARAEAAAEAAFRRVSGLNDILSDYETDSELSQLSRTAGTGKAVPISPDLWAVLRESRRFAELSNGAFDVTVGPCVNLWRKARRENKLPDAQRLAEARASVGHEKLQLDPARRTATLLVADMKLDLGG